MSRINKIIKFPLLNKTNVVNIFLAYSACAANRLPVFFFF